MDALDLGLHEKSDTQVIDAGGVQIAHDGERLTACIPHQPQAALLGGIPLLGRPGRRGQLLYLMGGSEQGLNDPVVHVLGSAAALGLLPPYETIGQGAVPALHVQQGGFSISSPFDLDTQTSAGVAHAAHDQGQEH